MLSLGDQGVLDPAGADSVELADEIDRQQQGLSMVRDLIGMHGAELDSIVTVDIAPIMK